MCVYICAKIINSIQFWPPLFALLTLVRTSANRATETNITLKFARSQTGLKNKLSRAILHPLALYIRSCFIQKKIIKVTE